MSTTIDRHSGSASNVSGKPLRVAHLVSHPIQYFAPLYRALAAMPDLDLTVYFYSSQSLTNYFDTEFGRKIQWDVPLLEGYRSVLATDAGQHAVSGSFDRKPSWSILRELWSKRYDVIWLHGYASANAWLALLIARLRGARILLREEQTLLTPRSGFKKFIKRLLLPLLYRQVGGLYIGENSRQFFQHYGTKLEFLYPARYCVDNAFFTRRREELAGERAACREKFGVPSGLPVILFCGKLVDKKQPELLLEAFARVRQAASCALLIAGDGPLRSHLEERIEAAHIPDVYWAGFLNQSELPLAYTASDLFVLPSAYQETWGLVVNEAMNFALPVVISDRVGCGADLVREGENGHIFPSGDAAALAAVLLRLVLSGETRARFGQRSAEIISHYSIEACAGQIAHACHSVVGRQARTQPTTAAVYGEGVVR